MSLAACSGSGGSGTTSAPVVVTPAPAPTPSPTPTPTPSPTYSTYAGLTGNQAFATACAALQTNTVPPTILPATHFGDGFAVTYTAATDTYLLVGDSLSLSFGPAERDPAAPSGVNTYVRVDGGITSRFTLGVPTASGVALTYTRGFGLFTIKSGAPVQYQCAYGVPTFATDLPSATFGFTKFALNGTVSQFTGGSTLTYRATNSVVTLSVNTLTHGATGTIALIGNQVLAGGALGPDTSFATYTLTVSIDPATGRYYGTIANAGGTVVGNIGGSFFGPQAGEALSSLSFADDVGGARLTVLANLAAIK